MLVSKGTDLVKLVVVLKVCNIERKLPCDGTDPGCNARRTVGAFAVVRVCEAPFGMLDVEVIHCSRNSTSLAVCVDGDDFESVREIYNVLPEKIKCPSNGYCPDVSCHEVLNGINSTAGTNLGYARDGGVVCM